MPLGTKRNIKTKPPGIILSLSLFMGGRSGQGRLRGPCIAADLHTWCMILILSVKSERLQTWHCHVKSTLCSILSICSIYSMCMEYIECVYIQYIQYMKCETFLCMIVRTTFCKNKCFAKNITYTAYTVYTVYMLHMLCICSIFSICSMCDSVFVFAKSILQKCFLEFCVLGFYSIYISISQ